MRKILISVLAILLAVLAYFVIMKQITIFNWQNKNLGNIKTLNDDLKEDIETAKNLNNSEYPKSITTLETSMDNLKIAKDKYLTKTAYLAENVELGVVKIKQYKIERLWVTLQNYAKSEGVELQLDIVENSGIAGAYNLEITVKGEYIPITDFIYDIEKDDTLGFKILNFNLTPLVIANVATENKETEENEQSSGENTEEEKKETTTQVVSGSTLKATFRIEGVSIEGQGTTFN